MFGINGGEFLVLALVALLVVGPERLPGYAEQLGRWVRRLRDLAGTAKERVAAELGEDAQDLDWSTLDPRRYDPRRIVREALLDEPAGPRPGPVTPGARRFSTGPAAAAAAGAAGATTGAPRPDEVAAGPPFDDEAT